MSTVLVIAPVVVASWPAISAAVVGAVGAMGFAAVREGRSVTRQVDTGNRAEIAIEDSEILAGTGQQEIVVQRDGVIARFSRDARGALKVCVEGGGLSKGELRQIGEELVGRVTQQYAYHRLMTEMKSRHMTVVEESVEADQTVRIRVRNS
ncbi:DUF1257 domain-containing protein [Planctomyces sp. SH-PL14]|uniref:DUF1257 domain-containing protein n=1 Tax=Planctomyces sp. SH-PL14 TaxID=1632864 RepID=UPI00078C390D|nr:DUF1257 domain-containing protein [Planctomyces sp. SH-PL14]AMV19805.1 hypothetical protein VT03_18045 [Planctomyces sp. SH-PL14]